MRTQRAAPALLAVWFVLFLIVFVPWGDFQGHTHWYKVTWVPFASPLRVVDIAANLAAFIPFGVLLEACTGRMSRGWRWCLAIGTAAALSFGAEAAQLFSHWRLPSATDVVTNVAGSAIGLAWAERRRNPGFSRR